MKFLAYFGTLIIIFGFFYTLGHIGAGYISDHPTLNETAAEPDMYLHNVKHYTKEFGTERSLYHLEKAITTIKIIETDIDLNTSKEVDQALLSLEKIYEEILSDSLIKEDMHKVFQYTLNALALAELRVSERYSESNHLDLAMVAMKYARLHIKNALKYADLKSLKFEQDIYLEVDSILSNESMAAVIITEKIDKVIGELEAQLNSPYL